MQWYEIWWQALQSYRSDFWLDFLWKVLVLIIMLLQKLKEITWRILNTCGYDSLKPDYTFNNSKHSMWKSVCVKWQKKANYDRCANHGGTWMLMIRDWRVELLNGLLKNIYHIVVCRKYNDRFYWSITTRTKIKTFHVIVGYDLHHIVGIN